MDPSMRSALWIVTPVYRDVESFLVLRAALLEEVRQLAGPITFESRFVVVDDTGGIDPEVDRLTFEDVRVLRPPFNLGHQRAIVFGLRVISREVGADDFVVTLDADGEDRPEDLSRLLEPLIARRENTRLVSLARRTKRRESPAFQVGYLGFKLAFWALTGLVVRTGNFAACRGWLVLNVIRHPHFDLCYSSSLISLNLDVIFVPCPRGTRYAGESRMHFNKLLMHGVRMMMPFLDRISIRALVAFSFALVTFVVLSITVVCIRAFTSLEIPGWTSYLLVFGVLGSVIAIGNFVMLFALFSQSRGLSLIGLEDRARNDE
jgi:glycosyltransferase involved in cell wall biosynthesis